MDNTQQTLSEFISELEVHLLVYNELSKNRATRIGNINAGKAEVSLRIIYRLKEIEKNLAIDINTLQK